MIKVMLVGEKTILMYPSIFTTIIGDLGVGAIGTGADHGAGIAGDGTVGDGTIGAGMVVLALDSSISPGVFGVAGVILILFSDIQHGAQGFTILGLQGFMTPYTTDTTKEWFIPEDIPITGPEGAVC